MDSFLALFTAENGIALLTLAVLEIVLGIDNIVCVSILADKLSAHEQPRPAGSVWHSRWSRASCYCSR